MKQNKSYSQTWIIKLLCLLVASLTYFVFAYAVQQERTVTMPIEIKMPDDYVAVSNVPEEVKLVIKGSEDRIYMINTNRITLSADFSNPSSEGVMSAPVEIEMGDLNDVVDLSSVTIYTEPSIVKIYFEKGTK